MQTTERRGMQHSQNRRGGAFKKIYRQYAIGRRRWKCPLNINAKFFRLDLKKERWTTKCVALRLSVQSAKYIDVTVTSNIKSSQECNEAVKKANRILDLRKRNDFF